HKRSYFKLKNLIKIAFNHEVRNAFSHSEYEIRKDTLYLTKYKREIPLASLEESFIAAHLLQGAIYSFLERTRNEFIASDGYTEGGVSISPIVSEEGFAISIKWRGGPMKPTGRRTPINSVRE